MTASTENTKRTYVRRPLKFVDGSTLEERVAKVLSEILSDKYDCKVTIRFVPDPNVSGNQQVDDVSSAS